MRVSMSMRARACVRVCSTYGNVSRLATAICSGACTGGPGRYCPPGSASSQGVLCPQGAFCWGGAAAPMPCNSSAGYYCAAGSKNETRTGVRCPPAYTCPGGTILPCPGVCGPVAWFDSTMLSLSLANGARVMVWQDMSGGAYGSVGSVMDVEAADASSAPVYNASAMAGGGPGVVFNGAGEALSSRNLGAAAGDAAMTFFAVIVDTGTTDACCGGVVTTTSATGAGAASCSGITLARDAGGGGGGGGALNVEYGTDRTRGMYNLGGRLQRVLTVVYNASGSGDSYVDGCHNAGPVAAAAVIATGTGGIRLNLGARDAAAAAAGAGGGGAQYFKGAIGEVLVYNGALDDASRRAVEAYLADKWPTRVRLACVRGPGGGSGGGSGGCPGGTYRDAAGNCDWCTGAPGRYCPANGTQPGGGVECPAGSACVGARAPAVPCAPGRFANTSGLATCAACSPGRYAAGNGSTGCEPCAGGTFTHAAGSAACVACGYGGRALVGAVACDAPASLAVRGGGACLVQRTADVACWGGRWPAPFVLWRGGDARARGGSSFIVNASGVCLGDAFVSVLLCDGSVVVVAGDLLHNASAAAVLAAPPPQALEQLWCSATAVCGRDASTGSLVCASVATPARGGPPVLTSISPPAAGPVLALALGNAHACTLAPNGTAACVGWGPGGSTGGGGDAPPDAMLHIAAAQSGSLTCGVRALDRAGVCWYGSGSGSGTSEVATPSSGGPPALKSVCVSAGGLACGRAWAAHPAVPNDAAYTGDDHEVCWNASTGAAMPGAVLLPGAPPPPLRAAGCSDAGRCGVLGNWSALCDRGSLRPACNSNYSSTALGLAPGDCFGIVAIAVDVGHAPGAGPGDVVEVTLSRASGACRDGANVTDGGTFYSPLARAGGTCPAGVNCMANASLYSGGVVWDAALPALRYTVGTGPGPSVRHSDNSTFYYGIDATRIGALAFGVNAADEVCAGPLPGARATLVGGSWGPQPAPRVASATAYDTGGVPGLSRGDTLRVVFDRETSRPPAPAATAVLSASLTDSGAPGAVTTAWADTSTLVITIHDPGAAAGAAVAQIGLLRLALAPALGILSRDLTSPPANVSGVPVGGTWGNSILSVTSPASLGALTTAGGDTLVVRLSATLGVGAVADDVRLVYGNGRWSFSAVGCVLAAGGVGMTCTTAEGVGANLAFAVVAYGAVVARGGVNASYATPTVRVGAHACICVCARVCSRVRACACVAGMTRELSRGARRRYRHQSSPPTTAAW